MNKSTSQPYLSSSKNLDDFTDDTTKFHKQPENQQIQQFKVILKNLPQIQKHKWPTNRMMAKQGVHSLSNLECIVEDSLEESSNFVRSLDEIDNLQYIDSEDSLENIKDQIGRNQQLNSPIEFRYEPVQRNTIQSSVKRLETISTITDLSNKFKSNSDRYVLDDLTRHSKTNQTNSDLHTKRSNYQSNLNNFNNLNKKSNYKQIDTDDDNFFFGPPNQELKEQKLRDTASRNRKIANRQNFCDYLTIFLILTAFLSIFVAIILLFLIALDAWSMQVTFTVTLIALCILTVLLVLFASFTANFVWYFNSSTNSINWMLHYGRKRNNATDYYFGKSLKINKNEENNNDIESNLIEQV